MNEQQEMFDKKTILVTGCSGFIGSHLTEFLLKKGHKVYGIDIDPLGKNQFYEYNQKRNFFFHHGDIRIMTSMLYNSKIDSIVHLAAKNQVPKSIKYPQNYLEHNIEASGHLLEWARKEKIKRFIYASSSSTLINKSDFSENHPIVKFLDKIYTIF